MQRFSSFLDDQTGTKPVLSASVRRDSKLQQCAKIAELRLTLMAADCHTLDDQAGALSLGRSTTWALFNVRHKSSGLSASIVGRILGSSELPPAARRVIEEYVREKLAGTYGHGTKQLKKFHARLSQLHPDKLVSFLGSKRWRRHERQLDISIGPKPSF